MEQSSRGYQPTGDLMERELDGRRPAAWPSLCSVAGGWGGLYVGMGSRGHLFSPPESQMLVLGPPRSGKSSAVVIPNVLVAPGPVIFTSTKLDVAKTVLAARKRRGRVWCFDPTGAATLEGVSQMGWSPLGFSADWDGAVAMAHSMVATAVPARGTLEASHWQERAEALLAPLLHAAALGRATMREVVSWVLCHEVGEAADLLRRSEADLAGEVLEQIAATEARERSAIFSTTAEVLAAYRSKSVLEVTELGGPDPDAFLDSADSIAVAAPSFDQALYAPLVVGLIEQFRQAAYRRWARVGGGALPLLLALDEAANIAPLPQLASVASEGASQGIALLVCLQDLSQARQRWRGAAEGFFSLFGAKLLLPGIGDLATLEAISSLAGEEEVRAPAAGHNRGGRFSFRNRSQHAQASTRRQKRLSVAEVADGPAGSALYMEGTKISRVQLTPWFSTEPWRLLAGIEPL